MITAQNLLVIAARIPLGLLVGYPAVRAFMASFTTDQYNFDLQMRASTLTLSAVAILIVALLSQRPGLQAVRHLDVAVVVGGRSL